MVSSLLVYVFMFIFEVEAGFVFFGLFTVFEWTAVQDRCLDAQAATNTPTQTIMITHYKHTSFLFFAFFYVKTQ